VGSANGGVWRSENAGTTWRPIFDAQPNLSIGDIAIAPSNPDIVWVGTGEANARQSTTYGAGVYKSTDAGKTWTLMGLENSGHIGRILIDPRNPQVVYVAAVGDLFKPNDERGLFKTDDGGRTWVKSRFIDTNTGFTELVMDPSNPDVLIAASYQRRRTVWGFNGGGPGSALWKTTDAGRTWSRIEGGGLPPYGNWGRVGLDFSRSNPNVLYAVIEPGPSPAGRGGRGAVAADAAGGRGGGGGAGGRGAAPNAPPDPTRPGVWRSDDKGRTWRQVSNENGRPMYFSQIRVDPKDPNTIYVLQRSLAKSTDGGRTYTTIPEAMLSRIQNPSAPSEVPPFTKATTDAFPPSHPDHHAMWINPDNPRHIWIGHDGGVDVSYDAGHSWRFVDNIPIGQFYEVAVDMREPYRVYGGAQDSGIWSVPSRVRNGGGITSEHVSEIALGDGYSVLVDPTDWATLYAQVSGNGGQHTWRYNLRTGEQKYVRPTPPRLSAQPGGRGGGGGTVALGANGNIATPLPPDEQLRFNWNPAIALSPHNPSTLYYGANRLFISRDRGDTWIATADLTRRLDRDTFEVMGVRGAAPMSSKNDGVAQWGTIVSIAESPLLPGVLWVGTDDGALQVSRDGGATWRNVADRVRAFPSPYYVEFIEASRSGAGTAYVAFDGHHSGDYKPYLFKTTDYGETWTDLSASVPGRGHINVVREDRFNPNLLFVGTETGFFVSLDGGRRFVPLMGNLPATIMDDVLIHPRDQDLVLGTHGRSFFILDDITPLQQLTSEVLSRSEHLFRPRPAVLWDHDRLEFHGGGEDVWRAPNAPDAIVAYYLRAPAQGPVSLQIVDATGTIVRELVGSPDAGLHRVTWDLRGGSGSAGRVEPGTYAVKLLANGRVAISSLAVRTDPNRASP
jgi:photosystem II stability/assembly factor-like uncharacterized protein